nr:thaumatin-like protein 1 [Quercus suber]
MAGGHTAMLATALLAALQLATAQQHMRHEHKKRQTTSGEISIVISNQCSNTIWPAMLTQSGTGPGSSGFSLDPGANQTLTVGTDWTGRVWARTNCSFTEGSRAGAACSTGDCGGVLSCKIAGAPPATLAEWALGAASNQDFYDISLVDGYNLPMAMVLLTEGISALEHISQATTNPSCVGSLEGLAATNFDPYSNNQQFLGTSGSDPLPFEKLATSANIASWCPWDLQINAPTKPGSGVYPYPDGNIARPAFDPCISACSKYNTDAYCCLGSHGSPSTCSPSYYSRAAKKICPDAYSYAYDDQTSTFSVPSGGGYQVIFCPGGRSTNIIASKGTSAIEHGGSSNGSSPVGSAGTLLIDGFAVFVPLSFTIGLSIWELLA